MYIRTKYTFVSMIYYLWITNRINHRLALSIRGWTAVWYYINIAPPYPRRTRTSPVSKWWRAIYLSLIAIFVLTLNSFFNINDEFSFLSYYAKGFAFLINRYQLVFFLCIFSHLTLKLHMKTILHYYRTHLYKFFFAPIISLPAIYMCVCV